MEVFINGKSVKTPSLTQIGKGGEADIFKLSSGQVLKIWKPPTHADYDGDPHEQKGAARRIKTHQTKLKAFPKGLPFNVIAPDELALTRSGEVAGYTMRGIENAELLMRFSEKSFRQSGNIPNERVVKIFENLHQTVAGIHQANVVIGDFNDLNELVKSADVFIIDADSFQYGQFFCMTFTQKFVDPTLCDPKQMTPVLAKPHNPHSDWYAFCIMLMQSLLFVGPYGGVYKPKDQKKRIPHDARALHRITVFDPEVVYPKPAIHYQMLTDELLHLFHKVFAKDHRDKFPVELLRNITWKTCKKCGMEFARPSCPVCDPQIGQVIKEKIVVTTKGKVSMKLIFKTGGAVLYATMQKNPLTLREQLCYVVHEQGELKREGNETIFRGAIEPGMRFRIQGRKTIVGKGNEMIVLEDGLIKARESVDAIGTTPVFDANGLHMYWAHNGRLVRDGEFGASEYIGDILQGQTHFWVGPTFGFGFYWAGMVRVGFVFDIKNRGINDTVKLPSMRGQLVDTRCYFSNERAWFLWMSQENGVRTNHCIVLKKDGTVLAHSQTVEGDGSWLGTIGGKCALADILITATDEGLVQVGVDGADIVEKQRFPDTEPFVDSGSSIFPGDGGIYVVSRGEISHITIQR
jgi:hypothetical protein